MYSALSFRITPLVLKKLIFGLLGLSLLSFILAWVSNRFLGTQGWAGFLVVLLIGAGLMLLGWRIVRRDVSLGLPTWLGWILILAAFLRLAAGVFWFLQLPVWGYGSPVEVAGYIMADAHARDLAAWELAQSGNSLMNAFGGYRIADQYGGMLFLSALVYRYAGGGSHMPLQIVVLTASFSALAALFAYAFARRAFDRKIAGLAAWILVLFPDAIILGGSQMREGFLMTLVAIACYGFVRFQQERSWSGIGFVFGGLVLVLPFSPPIGGILLLVLVILALSVGGWQAVLRQPRFWIVVGGLALATGIGIWLAWGRIAPKGITNPFALVGWWFTQTARWQAYFVRRSSWLIKRIFRTTPDWTHILILMAYGVVQPFLPAAIMDSGNPIWKGIAIWRALGWNILLVFLLVAPIIGFLKRSRQRLIIGIVLAVWGVILLAALRSGGDLWDNPRYRLTFICLQAILAGWVWFEQQEDKVPLLSWTGISLGIILAWFIPWYLQRYGLIAWPVTDVFATIGLGLGSVVLFFVWKLYRAVRKRGIMTEKKEL